VAGVQMTLGDISRSQGDLRDAVAHYEAALVEAAGVVPRVELTLRRQLAETYDALGEALPALRHLQEMVRLREELDTRERQSEVEELEMRYQVEQHERQLEVLTLDAALQEARLRQRTIMLVATAAALLLASLAALLAWRGYRTEVRLEKKLTAHNESLEAALNQINHMARTDPLTGLWNRRAFEELAAREMERAARSGQPLALAMADIDRFKPLNDRHGHSAGDEVLKEVAVMLRAALREIDVVCRWGGEEFLCLMPASDTTAARRAMDRVRHDLSTKPLEVDGGAFTVTMTYGIAAVHDDLKLAIAAADGAMYEGKRAGRDRIEVAEESTTSA
jgi:diguanylate cyclase (GGDEF)-like protein